MEYPMASERTITVIQDTREKNPLLFPATMTLRGRRYTIEVFKMAMVAGDYTVQLPPAGLWGRAIVERKAGLREVFNNLLTADKRRFNKAIKRLCDETEHPILLLEARPSELVTPSKYFPNPGPIAQKLFDLCAEKGITLLMLGRAANVASRRLLGEVVLRILLAYEKT